MPGARCTRGLVRKRKGGLRARHTGSAEASSIPCVMALRLGRGAFCRSQFGNLRQLLLTFGVKLVGIPEFAPFRHRNGPPTGRRIPDPA
jgi:hypothetical protein